MDTVPTAPVPPLGLVRSGLVATDLAAVPLLAMAFLTVLTLALSSAGTAAGGVYLVLGLRFLYSFPVFPLAARILCGMSLFAFAALLAFPTLLLWDLLRSIRRRYWSWHRAAWSGDFARAETVPGTPYPEGGRRPALVRGVRLSALVFLGLFAASLALMFALARGPFWHVWGWFV